MIEIKLVDVMTAFFDEKIKRGELAVWWSPLRFDEALMRLAVLCYLSHL